jgi:hypothetical protein
MGCSVIILCVPSQQVFVVLHVHKFLVTSLKEHSIYIHLCLSLGAVPWKMYEMIQAAFSNNVFRRTQVFEWFL